MFHGYQLDQKITDDDDDLHSSVKGQQRSNVVYIAGTVCPTSYVYDICGRAVLGVKNMRASFWVW